MLCGLENTKSMCYTEETQASKNLFLIFNTSFTKKKTHKTSKDQKFDLVRLSNYFVWVLFGSIAELSQTQFMDRVLFSSIEFNCRKHSSIGFDWLCRE